MNTLRHLSTVVVALLMATPVAAQNADDWESWPIIDKWSIGLGYFVPDLNTQIVITDEDGNIGTGISFEQNLGLDDSKATALLFVNWHFARRHALEYRYFQLNRSGAGESSVSIGIGDEIFDITLPIQSFFDITANEIAYAFSALIDERKHLYLGLGLSVQDLALGIQGTASSPVPGDTISSNLAKTAPLPTLNFGFDYAFNDQWIFISRLGWLAVEVDFGEGEDLSGEIYNFNLGVQWNAFENAGFFLHYQAFSLDVDYLDNGALFAIDYQYKGPVLGVDVRF
ncbi:MAG: hypothetical protein GWP62_10225 [Gammaproteobacteria bacterium]|nr:hypothetical protein [Gammaproteobacteria bacterium]